MKVTVMEACKNFFDYSCSTGCGYPSIDLEGSDADWLLLKENATTLIKTRCTLDFRNWWLRALFPLLDKVIKER
jgi:hypothetical protein